METLFWLRVEEYPVNEKEREHLHRPFRRYLPLLALVLLALALLGPRLAAPFADMPLLAFALRWLPWLLLIGLLLASGLFLYANRFYAVSLFQEGLVLRNGSKEIVLPFSKLHCYLSNTVPRRPLDYLIYRWRERGITLITSDASYILLESRLRGYDDFIARLERFYLGPAKEQMTPDRFEDLSLSFGLDLSLRGGRLIYRQQSLPLTAIERWMLIQQPQPGPASSLFLLRLFRRDADGAEQLFCEVEVRRIGNRALLQYLFDELLPQLKATAAETASAP